ncbi:e9imm peptide [Streptomyces liangshanensis]|uniref:E9imm peptide n=1 Tax=Streptomyces liangshanensis TaxID=2717324 RepID=A0A6G9HAB6_9ACTN|nr:e9imm peptide [Streptomyces liangshanensis]QIQ07256.1 e9imm peptide [Streptomyces liangshanensis]
MAHAAAVALVQRIMDADHADEAELAGWLDALDKTFACPSGHVRDLIFWPEPPEPSAAEVVDRALAYRPIAL